MSVCEAATPGGARVSRIQVVASDGVRVPVWLQGPERGPTIVLVHGFLDDHTVWNPVADLLATEFRVASFDVRGSGQADRPRRVVAYRLDQLAADLERVVDAVSPGRPVHVVAHDWGSVQAWHAITRPGASARLASLTSISGGCLDHVPSWVAARVKDGPTGWRALGSMWKSPFYMGLLQVPGLGQLVCRSGLVDFAIRWSERFVQPSNSAQLADQRALVNAAAVRIYAANLLPRLLRPRPLPTDVPVNVLVPRRDVFVTAATATVSMAWAKHLTIQTIPGGHWVAVQRPSDVAGCVRTFVRDIDHGVIAATQVGKATR